MVIDPKRREMFADLYRLAEYYENPPFIPGDIEGNAKWFIDAMSEVLNPFLAKYDGSQMAMELAFDVVEDANRKAVAANKEVSVL